MDWDEAIYEKKDFAVIEMWDSKCWRLYKTSNNVKKHIRENFRFKRSLATEHLLEKIENGKLCGYGQCDIEVPDNLRARFSNFPAVFKNTLDSKNDTGGS